LNDFGVAKENNLLVSKLGIFYAAAFWLTATAQKTHNNNRSTEVLDRCMI
jgi:hypothetical protein